MATGGRIDPAEASLLENFSVIEEHCDLARQELARPQRLPLPRLVAGDSAGLPRVFDLAKALIGHSDVQLDGELLEAVMAAYQSQSVLLLRELWAMSAMLRLALLEHLARIARGLTPAKKRVSPFAPRKWRPFAERKVTMVGRARQRRACPTLRAVADGGGNGCLHHQRHRRFAHAGSLPWREFVERQSAVEAVLRRDPLAIYPQMNPKSRDCYRKAVEELACRCPLSESQVAQAAVELAGVGRSGDRFGGAASSSGREGMKERHVGYFLVDRGRGALEERIGYRPGRRERMVRLARPALPWLAISAALRRSGRQSRRLPPSPPSMGAWYRLPVSPAPCYWQSSPQAPRPNAR